jgi:hypothetical protein
MFHFVFQARINGTLKKSVLGPRIPGPKPRV